VNGYKKPSKIGWGRVTLSSEITRMKCYEKESKIALKKAEELMRKNGMSLRIILH